MTYFNSTTETMETYITISASQMGEMPAATYIGNDTWLGADGVYYIVD